MQGKNKSTWMAAIEDDKFISELTIPGTHDSCTFQADVIETIASFIKTQSASLYEQLFWGCRFLDIRGRDINDKLAIHHGKSYLDLNFQDVIDVCKRFLTEQPSETILLSLKPEHVSDPSCTKTYPQIFDSYYQQDPSLWYLEDRIPELGEVRGKIILLRRFDITGFSRPSLGIDFYVSPDGEPSPHKISSNQHLYTSDKDDLSKYGGIEGKKRAISTNLLSAEENTGSNNLYLTFTSGYSVKDSILLTLNPIDILRRTITGSTLIAGSAGDIASKINPWLEERFNSINCKKKGVVIVDFVTPKLAGLLVEQNRNDFLYNGQKWYLRGDYWGEEYYSIEDNDYHYVDTNENCAPNNHVVVGLKLYKKSNRMAIGLYVAPLNSRGLVASNAAVNFHEAPGWGNNYFDIEEASFVDTNGINFTAPDRVMIGAKLYQKGNRVAIAVQSASINPNTQSIDYSSKQWHDDRAAWGEESGGVNYLNTDNFPYVDTSGCTPAPYSFLTGAGFRTKGDNRIALQVSCRA